jgi:hypothetical protein
MDREREIREQAYHLWVKEGRPHGRHDEHWKEAARLLAGEVGVDTDANRSKARAAATAKLAKKASASKKKAGSKKTASKKASKKDAPKK